MNWSESILKNQNICFVIESLCEMFYIYLYKY